MQFTQFPPNDVPPYAILSHTWKIPNDREVSYQDMRDGLCNTDKDGYVKIQHACKQAITDELQYIWIDTCCIDKTDRVELEKAINSMYAWYKASEVCYVYMDDVLADQPKLAGSCEDDGCVKPSPWLSMFTSSRWFTRGWALQELIAPRVVRFYSHSWKYLGNRLELANLISRVTNIDERALDDESQSHINVGAFSIAQRIAWAANRETTEPEDLAYCLVGILDVFMTPQYGEGQRRAFTRLQREIMKDNTDQSILAWVGSDGGLLAPSPVCFSLSHNIAPPPLSIRENYHDLVSAGLRMIARLVEVKELYGDLEDSSSATHVVPLTCRYQHDLASVPGLLVKSANGRILTGEPAFYAVGGSNRVQKVPLAALKAGEEQRICIFANPPKPATGVQLALVRIGNERPTVSEAFPRGLWQVGDVSADFTSYHFNHDATQPQHVFAGARVLYEDEYAVDVIFESHAAKGEVRLLSLCKTVDDIVEQACQRAQKNYNSISRPWTPWADESTEFTPPKDDEYMTVEIGAPCKVAASDHQGVIWVTQSRKSDYLNPVIKRFHTGASAWKTFFAKGS